MNENPGILIIEDDIDLVESLKKILETKDYNVKTANDPDEGYEKINKEKPDLIILDVMFGSNGETKGFDFSLRIRNDKQFAGIPVLMLTAVNISNPFYNFSPETDGEYLPVDCFLDKPFQPAELISKVEELLKQKTSKWQNWPDKGK
jgi:DNA-binding response OmpR family regulator